MFKDIMVDKYGTTETKRKATAEGKDASIQFSARIPDFKALIEEERFEDILIAFDRCYGFKREFTPKGTTEKLYGLEIVCHKFTKHLMDSLRAKQNKKVTVASQKAEIAERMQDLDMTAPESLNTFIELQNRLKAL